MLSRLLFLFALIFFSGISTRAQDSLTLASSATRNDFSIVSAHGTTNLFIDSADFKVVQIAATCLATDIQRVTGKLPEVKTSAPQSAPAAILIGTIGHSSLIDNLIHSGKLDVSAITGKWESSIVATVADPLPGVSTALVIAGSDRRGTAYGVFDVSEAIGVSPWVWWADVNPAHRDTLALRATTHIQGPPSVKYRGIFINDEDWGFHPWAANTIEPDLHDSGPKTYAKVFELLLRLKANYLWPAMHSVTKAFNIYPENKIVADNYAIVMGSSHAEPMLRNNVTEYDQKARGPWDYDLNRDGILKYWEERVKENAAYENTYTIGMRGIHDSAMPGGGTMAEKVARLQRVLTDQHDLLARDVNPKVEEIPQIFVPYKEVLILYQNGLKVPDYATLVWPDDNHGYIRELSNSDEQKRSGGSGVYYHVSYYGAPADYLWLCTTPPALIWEEMSKAYDNGARNLWVLNVGDIKPAEVDIDFFMHMAWDIKPWNADAQPTFLYQWAARTFGKALAPDIADILNRYYILNYPSKPEHLLYAKFTDNYHEKEQRLKEFADLVTKTNTLYNSLPADKKDSFYQLIAYPVRCSALINEKWLSASPDEAQKAYNQIQTETKYYNEQLAGGKWNLIMSANPREQPVFQAPAAAPAVTSAESSQTTASTGYISRPASSANREIAQPGAKWHVIKGLGRSGESIALLPTTVPVSDAVELDYGFTVKESSPASVQIYCIPTHALNPGLKLRYSAAIDQAPPQTVDIDTVEFSKPWSENVLRAAAIGTTNHGTLTPGTHTLRLHPLDPGLVFDKVVVDLGGLLPTQLGPPANNLSAR